MIRKLLVLALLFLPALAGAETTWDIWLKNEGYYLLGPKEKQKFQALPDAEKELYVRDLWASLDPDPITPENEFQEEYMKRFAYAKKNFSIPSDRAKIYVMLGAPNSVNREPNSDKYYPLELWSYYSLGFKGLPSSLDLIFFKRWGAGDYRLYSPLFDGMKSLTPSQYDFDNPRQKAMVNAYFDSDIMSAAERVAPGVGPNESEEVRMVLQDPDAFSRIERKKPTVETTVVYEGFEADVMTYSVPLEEGVMKTSIAVAIPPKYLTFEREDTTYRGRVDIIGRITDEKGQEILRISDSPAIKMNGADFDKAKGFFFSYLFDAFLLPGKYDMNLLYRDYASSAAGKVEKSFEVPGPPDTMGLTPPLIAFKSSPTQNASLPFTYNGQQYIPKEDSTFNNNQTVVFYSVFQNPRKAKLEGVWKLEMGLRNELQNVLTMAEDLPVSGTLNLGIERHFRLQNLTPGNYQLFLRLTGKENIYETSVPLRVGVEPEVLGRLRVIPANTRTPEDYHTNLALQYFYKGDYDLAAKHVRIALDFAPNLYAAKSLNARIEKGRGNMDAALQSYQKLLEEAPADSEGYFLVGKWWLEKKDLQKSSDAMKKALSLGYYTTEILNDLGSVELQMGNVKDALSYWEKSLALEPNQPEITKLVSENKKS